MVETPAVPFIRVLLIDDDPDFCEDLTALLSSLATVETAHSGQAGLELVARLSPDVVLLDIDLGSPPDGLDVLREIRKAEQPPPVVMLTGDRRLSSVVQAIRLGAFHYVAKPPEPEPLAHVMSLALGESRLRRKVRLLEEDVRGTRRDLVVESELMRNVLRQVDKVAPTEATVLITGESGTGKELVARVIHAESLRRDGPFVAVNCAAIPAELIESELFGHERGAFTGATTRRAGRFEQAAGGTLFLDELGDSPPALQVKILRVLEERRVTRVGGDDPVPVDLRILAATSKDVDQQVRRGELREELYYRLNVFPLRLPALRERPEDILPISFRFLGLFARQMGRAILDISPAAREYLSRHDWPGNVRQLRNTIERAVIQCEGRSLDLPDLLLDRETTRPAIPYEAARDEMLHQFKCSYLAARLTETGGLVAEAARRSGLKRQSFQRMLSEVGLDPAEFRRPARD